MKLSCASAEQLDIGPIGRESLIEGCLSLGERCRLEFAFERIERAQPGVPLVFDETL